MKRIIFLLLSCLLLSALFSIKFSIDDFQLFIVPAFAQTTSTVPLEAPIGSTTAIDLSGNALTNYTRIIFAFAGGIAGGLAMLMIIISGIQIMTGGGDMGPAKTRLFGAIAGLIVLAGGSLLLYEINPCFFTFQESASCTPRT